MSVVVDGQRNNKGSRIRAIGDVYEFHQYELLLQLINYQTCYRFVRLPSFRLTHSGV